MNIAHQLRQLRYRIRCAILRYALRSIGLEPCRVVIFTRRDWSLDGMLGFVGAAMNADCREPADIFAIPAELAEHEKAKPQEQPPHEHRGPAAGADPRPGRDRAPRRSDSPSTA